MFKSKFVTLALSATLTCTLLVNNPVAQAEGEVLYNGIRLPAEWPPKLERLTREPMPIPYLQHPPKLIPIDVGRQLFVDDFLVEETTLRRSFHQPKPYAGNPVLKADKSWEQERGVPYAMVFSDGVWYDPQDGKFKMWYLAGGDSSPAAGGRLVYTCYAESKDGVHWEKPELDIKPGTNIVLKTPRDSNTVWLDHWEKDPKRRYKMFPTVLGSLFGSSHPWVLSVRYSPDGIHWTEAPAASPRTGDRTTVFYNPFRSMWVFSLRISSASPSGEPGLARARSRAYREHSDPEAGLKWQDNEKFLWVGADRLDSRHPNFPHIHPQLYNLDAFPYESLMLGLFSVHQGPPNKEVDRLEIQKRNEVMLGFSRDGFHWHRPDRRPFIGVNQTAESWNWGNVQSAGGGCLVVGDKLFFYFSGRALDDKVWDEHGSTGLALLRRDGFASMDAGPRSGTLTTRPVRFKGRHLFVNVDSDEGELQVEVLDENDRVVLPFRRDNSLPIRTDKTLAPVNWKGAKDLSPLVEQSVKFRFHLTNGSLYAFWISPLQSGASHGYVAAGGPGLTSAQDSAGLEGYRQAEIEVD